MKVFVGADYRGFERKKEVLRFLAERADLEVTDVGTYDASENDFNDSAITVARAVRREFGSFGILICDSAHGMTMQANRFLGVRAAHCDSAESAKLARGHDDANVLCLSAHFIDEPKMREIVTAFLETKFTPLERRVRRINRLDEGENYA